MGLVKTEKLANGNIGLEITYGGKEAPFGGIDSSMPPQYIDPHCQVDVEGFVIINGQFVSVSFQPLDITINLPATGFTVPKLAGFGSFYTEAQGWQNFIVINGDRTVDGVNQTATANVALYVWPSANTATPAAIPMNFTQAITTNPGTYATLNVGTGYVNPPGGSGGTASAILVSADGLTTENYGPFPSSDTRTALITALVNAITALPSAICTAVVNADTVSATLTSKVTGKSQNNINFSAFATSTGTFSGTFFTTDTGFQGGTDSYTYPSGEAPYPASWVQVGESLYIGGPGTVILQYTNQIFSILSQYVGANVLRKFAGSLIALGITPSPGTVLQNAEMMLAWSAAGNYSTWNPTDASGNVTGAGFEQLADIGDPLTGGFVNSSTIVMLRAQGVSYATATGNATLPFDINHVDLAPEGEGCQGQLLSSQYGPVGFYVGNSNIYQFVQSGQPIGEKIKNTLYPQLSPATGITAVGAASKALSTYILSSEVVFFAVYVENSVSSNAFLYNTSNKTWTRLGYLNTTAIDSVYLDDFPISGVAGAQFLKQSQLVLGLGDSTTKTFTFKALTECIYNTNAGMPLGYNSTIYFPNEEIMFGRDITIDGLFVLMAGTAGQQVTFSLSDITGNFLGSSLFTFPAGATYTQLAQYQIFFTPVGTLEGTGTVTGQAPQLLVEVAGNGGSVQNQFRLAKVVMFGSFDPQQRPV